MMNPSAKKTMTDPQKIRRVIKKNIDRPVGDSKETVKNSFLKKKDGNPGEKIRRQVNELRSQRWRLKQGVDREKLAEEQIHILTEAMDVVSDSIFLIDAKKTGFPLIYANPSFRRLIGCAKDEIIGQDYSLVYGATVDSVVVKEIVQAMRDGRSFHGEFLSVDKNGRKSWNLLRMSRIYDSDGAITHHVGIQSDTTSIKSKDLQIAQQREDLLHVTRVGKLAEFVSSLAHEISQPLTAILSYAQAAQRMYAREPQLQEILQYIIKDDQRAAEVIRRLRLLLKKSKPVFEPIDINALVNDTVTLIMPHIVIKNKDIKFKLAGDLSLIRGDRVQLQQVFLNLISNSLEAMEGSDDSRKLSIRTSRKNARMLMVEVKDSGCGIPAENMDKLFTHFFTSKTNGLGMGLAISRSIIEAHGGRLNARNNSDGGATFYFTLPMGAL